MRGIFMVSFAVVVSAVLSGCGDAGTGGGGQASVFFINDFFATVHVIIEECEEFDLGPIGTGRDKHVAKCDFTGDEMFMIHLEATWVVTEGNPPLYRTYTTEVTARSGDTVVVRRTWGEFTVVVQSAG